ncbi:MAG: DNA translocase FtsK [Candidatus Babeliales bacterium]
MKLMSIKKLLIYRVITAFIVGLSIIFLFLSLISYNPEDSSYFSYHSSGLVVSNNAGLYGAQVAALLFFLFGSAALLLIPLLAFVFFMLVKKKIIKNEWERLVAFILLLPLSSTLLRLYAVDFLYSPYPGGLIGYLLYTKLITLVGFLPSTIFLWSMSLVCFFLITRFSFMPIVHYSIAGIQYSLQLLVHYKVIQWSLWLIYRASYFLLIRPFILLIQFFKKLFDGSLFEATNLITPQDQQDDSHALVELYELLQADSKKTVVPDGDQQDTIVAHKKTIKSDNENQTINQCETIEQQCSSEQSNIFFNNMEFKEKQPDQLHYMLPSLTIFIGVDDEQNDTHLKKELEVDAQRLQEKLERFGVLGKVVAIKRGPVVTLFEYKPQIDIKLSKIVTLEDDLALALQALSIRIIAPIPGRPVVGFEVANKKRKSVSLAQVIQSQNYEKFSGSLPLILGEDTIGTTVMVDLARMPHLLIAGSTGSGKSVALNAMLMSLLCKLNPDQLKLILIDPKRLEFSMYTDIAHLLFPIVTDPKGAIPALRWVVQQMEERYEKMAVSGARNIVEFNENLDIEDHLPFIVIVIDELSDLMLTAGRDIEHSITRIAQMARAAGIHMIVATQRPSVDVITGLIKVNFPSRISFRVTSRVDSRTILDCIGAEKLLGSGDMLFLDVTNSQLSRVHGAYVSDYEIRQVVDHIRAERAVSYLDFTQEFLAQNDDTEMMDDDLYQDIIKFLQEIDEISISLLQRKFRIGYNRSARIIDRLESHGLVMPPDGGKMRKVIR